MNEPKEKKVTGRGMRIAGYVCLVLLALMAAKGVVGTIIAATLAAGGGYLIQNGAKGKTKQLQEALKRGQEEMANLQAKIKK